MQKILVFCLAFSILSGLAGIPSHARAETSSSPSLIPSPYDLVDAVNALRVANGLPAYQVNSILMNISQAHSEYMASVGIVTHYGADGSRPFQRALSAGYPVAGDLSLGGFISENITAGINKTIEQAVEDWQGDQPHLLTMLSPDLRDIGAGIAAAGDYIYYTIDASKSTGGTPVSIPGVVNTPNLTPLSPTATRWHAPTATILPNTPNADGSIIHIARSGDTLFAIAIAYGVPYNDILKLNGLQLTSIIIEGKHYVIREANTPTPTPPTATPTKFPTSTLWPTSTMTPTSTPPLPTPTLAAPMSAFTGIGIVLGIAVLALLVAGGITLAGARSPRK